MDAGIYHHDSPNGFETYYTGDGAEIRSDLGGLGATTAPADSGNWLTSIVESISGAVQAAAPAVTAINQAKAAGSTTATGTAVTAAPPAPNTNKMIVYGALGLAGLGLLWMVAGRRRRR